MSSSKFYGPLFLLIFALALVSGYVVASSVHIGPLRPPDVFAHLATPTPTMGHVEVRLLTPSPASATSMSTPKSVPTATERPVPTVVVQTLVWSPSPTTAPTGPTLVSTPTHPSASPSATGVLEPTTTPTMPAFLYAQDGPTTVRPELSCYVGAVFGWVRDERGQPLAGVHLRVYDPWNHSFPAISKPAPDAGYYDVILGTTPATWYVVVVDTLGNQLSPVVSVEHKEGSPGCWYEVNFRRTSSSATGSHP